MMPELHRGMYVKIAADNPYIIMNQYKNTVLKVKNTTLGIFGSTEVWLLNSVEEYTCFTTCCSEAFEPVFMNHAPTKEEVEMFCMLGYKVPKELYDQVC